MFKDLLKAAAGGNDQALETLLLMYMPLISKMSVLYDEYDDDLHQEQLICFWYCVKKFADKYL